MRIFELSPGSTRRITALPADRRRAAVLQSLGLVRGAAAEIVFAARYGIVVRVSGVRVALSRRAAMEVEVSPFDTTAAVRQSQFGQEHAV